MIFPDEIVSPRKLVCGRMNCNLCGHWRYAFEFPTQHARGKLYIKSNCKVCIRKRRKQWYANKTPAERLALNRYQKATRSIQRKREQTKLLLGQSLILANGRADAWPVRRWLLQELASGRELDQIAFSLDVDPERVIELAQGYKVISDCNYRPIRTVDYTLLERVKTDAAYRTRSSTRRKSR